jgi:hypothetical protein
MSSPILTDLANEVTSITGVVDSAIALINGFAARMQAAVDAALLNGATAAELAPVQAEVDSLKASDAALAAAVAANTPTPPAPPAPPAP